MKLLFLNRGDQKLGSNRICIKNLCKWVKPLVKIAHVSRTIKKGYDFYICSKYCSSDDIVKINQINNNSIVGLIHPSTIVEEEKKKLKLADFLIAGSIEEKDFLLKYSDKIFRFPQIENFKINFKKHKNKKKIILGYHGNLQNLIGSNQNYIRAIEKLSRKYNLELHLIYDKKLGVFKNKKIKLKFYNWSEKNIGKFLSKVDIGIVPATNNSFFDRDKNNIFLHFFKSFFSTIGRSSDYIIQFKFNSNPGRSHVFHQAGIPVVAGFWPSHFEILSNTNNGFLAHSSASWYISIEKFILSHQLRNKTAKNANNTYKKFYNPKNWSIKFINYLKKIKNEKN